MSRQSKNNPTTSKSTPPKSSADKNTAQQNRDAQIRSLKSEFEHVNKLRFNEPNESQFQAFRRTYFITQDRLLLFSGVVAYMCFILGDLTLIPTPFNYYSAIVRSVIIAILLLILWLIYAKRVTFFKLYAIESFGLVYFLGVLHLVIISALCPFPYNYLFTLGIVTITSTMGMVFRLNFRVCAISSTAIAVLVGLFLFVFQTGRIIKTNLTALDNILVAFPYIFSGFVVAMCLTSMYLCYFFERQTRSQWLEKNIRLLESEKLTELTNQFKFISQQDALTNISNRRHFFEQAETLLTQHRRNQDMLSVIMMDVDLFKKYNDSYGHIAGDSCLKKIADTIFSTCRRSKDLLARYGGEEFILLLPYTPKEDAMNTAKLIRQTIYNLGIVHKKSPFKQVTISLGVTTLTCHEQLDIKDIIANADHALYQSKNKGRNAVTFYSHAA